MLLALKNCMNVCPHPQELYNSKQRARKDDTSRGNTMSSLLAYPLASPPGTLREMRLVSLHAY